MRLTPEEMRGRVFGVLRTLMQSTPLVGGALAGVLLGGPAVALPLLVMSGVMAVPGFVGLLTPRPRPRRKGDRSRRPDIDCVAALVVGPLRGGPYGPKGVRRAFLRWP